MFNASDTKTLKYTKNFPGYEFKGINSTMYLHLSKSSVFHVSALLILHSNISLMKKYSKFIIICIQGRSYRHIFLPCQSPVPTLFKCEWVFLKFDFRVCSKAVLIHLSSLIYRVKQVSKWVENKPENHEHLQR